MIGKLKIIIGGAGLGGLAAAACLLMDGHDVDVYEQAPELGEVGAGIQISANAMHVLNHIGVGQTLGERSVRPEAYTFCMGDTGEVIQSFELSGEHERNHGAPYYHVHRMDILDLLAKRVEELKPGAIHTGYRLVSYDEKGDSVTASFANGESATGDLLIGADGLKSVVREQMHGTDNPHYTGDAAWRFVVPTEKVKGVLPRIEQRLWMMPGGHAVTYFLRRGELVNFVGLIEKEKPAEESWTTKHSWEELKADFKDWNPMLHGLIDQVDKDACYLWALHIREPVKGWSTKRVTMLGDAVHPTLPYLAQGAAMAFEDGAVLSRTLKQESDLPAALDLYERNRYERTARIVRESSANGKLFHHPSREALLEAFNNRDMGKERSMWLFNYNPWEVELV
ncbi:MAG: FAD-dependent monooxygenase [Hyphomicrobiales bacterium]|nr:FAD-dependent monooxygenase [Hyphomicrobiales bacterium]